MAANLQWNYFKMALSTAMEYKTNFIIQVMAMFFNDVVWMVFWLIFFNRFKNVGGWELNDMLMLYSIVCLSYGLSGFFFGNRNRIAGMVNQGKLDFYLTLPRNTLYHILISSSNFYDLGDILFGISVAFFCITPEKIPLFIIFTLLSTIIFTAFGTITGTLAFYFGNAEETSRTLFMGVLSFASYPLSIYSGAARFILLTLIPAGFITGIPVEVLKVFSMKWFLLTFGFTFLITLIAVVFFYIGLKRYESGNLMHVRM